MSKITRIRIPAEFRTDNSQTRTEVADFKLGLGPCGKEVVDLNLGADEDYPGFIVVGQTHSDGTRKCFIYPPHTLTGRVEVTIGD